MKTGLRQRILDYVLEQYGTQPAYLWSASPETCALRHRADGKWYGVVMSVSRSALGLEGDGRVDVLNVKLSPSLIGSLTGQKGYLPGYHMNKTYWLSVLLDGTVAMEDILPLLALSHQATARRITGKKRPPGKDREDGE